MPILQREHQSKDAFAAASASVVTPPFWVPEADEDWKIMYEIMYENQRKIFHSAKYELIQFSTVKTSFLPFFHHSDTSGFSVLKKVVFTVF